MFTDYDIYLFKEGNHFTIYEKLGSHLVKINGVDGAYFAVWAPNAQHVSVIGDFNAWNVHTNPMNLRKDGSGIWEVFVPNVASGAVYKYHIVSKYHNYRVDKGDPYAFYWEVPSRTASRVWDLDYKWNDDLWMKERVHHNSLDAPISIYEIHPGSWRRVPEEKNRFLTYRELAPILTDYVKAMGWTHVEFLPVMEHPLYRSWGYQTVGYFAPTSRYGTPQDFMFLVDYLHQNDIAVILDWVPSHFPSDQHGLSYFDGTYLYEHADRRKGFHPDWKTCIFNYGRGEVQSFLISNALFWLKKYHIDGIRVDAVASMLYLDYSRKEGEWIPNEYGGRENIEAINFIRRFNEVVYGSASGVQTFAEESTAWSMVSRPAYVGGLGFGMKWNMGWMHDTIEYFKRDPIHRKCCQNDITFSMWYAFTENFLLPLSHDEVVHGKGSLFGKMSGDTWQKFANLRLLFGYMFMHPGKKLLFMGDEIGQWKEWDESNSIDWDILKYSTHEGIRMWVRDLNYFYRSEPALYELDFEQGGFKWIDFHDANNSVISFLRMSKTTDDVILAVCNFTPVPRYNYKINVPAAGFWKEALNSDAGCYGGSNQGNMGGVKADTSISLTLPPLGIVVFKKESP